ncbi:hypothetical protein [Streptomyces lydicus]|uniref:hypothetical protein n=1 Tax=Streptomyces lydicus TaxID=47763 RepID=UPI0036FAF564
MGRQHGAGQRGAVAQLREVPLCLLLIDVAVLHRVLRTVHSLCARLGERGDNGGLVRAVDLGLDLLVRAARSVPRHHQIRVEIGFELPGQRRPLLWGTDVQPLAAECKEGMGVEDELALGYRQERFLGIIEKVRRRSGTVPVAAWSSWRPPSWPGPSSPPSA